MIQTIDIANQDLKHQNHEQTSSSSLISPTLNDNLLADDQQRGRSRTITQKNINNNLYLNDQDKLHHAIQKFDTMEHKDPLTLTLTLNWKVIITFTAMNQQ
ncbi:unnamed protein product [Absidia cylindrospora]